MKTAISALLLLCSCGGAFAQDGAQQFASLGDFKLESGEVIRDCRIGYRAFGKLDSAKSNAVAFPTWFTGTSKELVDYVGAGKFVDPASYYVVTVDALANGASSSPSTSTLQPRLKFPRISVRDMVNSQHQLLTQVLGIPHVKAVMGDSMGGMQTFQWIVAYPDFMEKAIPIVGSPRLAPYDLALWNGEIQAIKGDPAWNNGDYSQQPAVSAIAYLEALVATTPAKYNSDTSRDKVLASMEDAKKGVASFDANDRIRQLEAMIALDISRDFGGSMERAARAARARVLVVVGKTDHTVSPGPALEFARLMGAETLELQGDCGHNSPECEVGLVSPTIAAFLAK